MSITSPPARGRIRTWSPTLTSPPEIRTRSTGVLSSRSPHSHSFISPRSKGSAHHATPREVLEIVLPASFPFAPGFASRDRLPDAFPAFPDPLTSSHARPASRPFLSRRKNHPRLRERSGDSRRE